MTTSQAVEDSYHITSRPLHQTRLDVSSSFKRFSLQILSHLYCCFLLCFCGFNIFFCIVAEWKRKRANKQLQTSGNLRTILMDNSRVFSVLLILRQKTDQITFQTGAIVEKQGYIRENHSYLFNLQESVFSLGPMYHQGSREPSTLLCLDSDRITVRINHWNQL